MKMDVDAESATKALSLSLTLYSRDTILFLLLLQCAVIDCRSSMGGGGVGS